MRRSVRRLQSNLRGARHSGASNLASRDALRRYKDRIVRAKEDDRRSFVRDNRNDPWVRFTVSAGARIVVRQTSLSYKLAISHCLLGENAPTLYWGFSFLARNRSTKLLSLGRWLMLQFWRARKLRTVFAESEAGNRRLLMA